MYVTKLWKALGSPVIDVTVKKAKLLVYVLNFCGILAHRCGNVVVRERLGYERSRFDPGLRFSFFFHRNDFNNMSKIF